MRAVTANMFVDDFLLLGGSVVMRHVKAATKLAPLRTLSVPKLELNAALLGARLARFVLSSIPRPLGRRVIWTNSSTTRNWIRATAAMYQRFGIRPIGEIQALTEPREWRFVPGRLNPADVVTRSALESEAIPVLCLDGPAFLQQAEEMWPTNFPYCAVAEEIRPARTYVIIGPFEKAETQNRVKNAGECCSSA